MSDQTDQIAAAENVLREAAEAVLRPIHGEDWIAKSGITQERISKLQERLDEERKRRTGGTVEERLIYYSDLTDLQTIIARQWEQFKPIFDDRKAFDVDLDRLLTFRTAQMHGRPLLPYEQALVDGISGNVRNRVTIYRNMQAPGGKQFFPRFEWVRDSFGNECKGGSETVRTGLTLHPGDVVKFESSYWDPDGEPCATKWAFYNRAHDQYPHPYDGSIAWTVREEDIRVGMQVYFTLTGRRAYHRTSDTDDMAVFEYDVLPRD